MSRMLHHCDRVVINDGLPLVCEFFVLDCCGMTGVVVPNRVGDGVVGAVWCICCCESSRETTDDADGVIVRMTTRVLSVGTDDEIGFGLGTVLRDDSTTPGIGAIMRSSLTIVNIRGGGNVASRDEAFSLEVALIGGDSIGS